MMALLSQQVTIPAFLFAKIIYCPNSSSGSGGDGSFEIDGVPEIVCPSVAERLSDLWMLLVWPFFVVACGLFTGYLAAKVSKTPSVQVRSCLAACAFGNSTGLPITLLTVIHNQFKKSSELGRIDPTAFLSVYLLLYPVLQWGVGGWLLAPEEKIEESNDEKSNSLEEGNNGMVESIPLLLDSNGSENGQNQQQNGQNQQHVYQPYHISHLLNLESQQQSPAMIAGQEEFGGVRSRHYILRGSANSNEQDDQNQRWYAGQGGSSNDMLQMMVRELSFISFSNMSNAGSLEQMPLFQSPRPMRPPNRNSSVIGGTKLLLSKPQPETGLDIDDGPLTMDDGEEATAAVDRFIADANPPTIHEHSPLSNAHPSPGPANYTMLPRVPSKQQIQTIKDADVLPLTETLLRILRKVFQPPVIGALAGLFIASFPWLRGLMQNIWGDDVGSAPLKWMFDGIHSVGQAAVPINMTILGINLSSTFQKKKKSKKGDDDNEKSKLLSNQTMLAVVIGKMLVMPIIGIASTWILQRYYIDLPDEIDATCYLVMMIVFICPTANNVMVMVELSGSSSKEGMARLIGWQYFVSPIVLSLVLSLVVGLASGHFDEH